MLMTIINLRTGAELSTLIYGSIRDESSLDKIDCKQKTKDVVINVLSATRSTIELKKNCELTSIFMSGTWIFLSVTERFKVL